VRGKPNEPANVVHTARHVAELRGVAYEELELSFDDLVWEAQPVEPTTRSRSRTTTQGA